jgi:predicted secreted Zn-dependent protease
MITRRQTTILTAGFIAVWSLATAAAAEGWQAVERVVPYAVEGSDGLELYRSIGERGPKLGVARVIAHTGFKLTWTRKYERQDDACVITVNKPKLVITYTLPKLKGTLAEPLKSRWQTFVTGVTAHEKIHGDFIKDMVKEIEAISVGMREENDPECRKIRPKLQARLGELSQAQRARSREFDRVEMNDGGNVHQLILQLVEPR